MKKPLHEKILILILLIIASPFVLGIFAIFIIIYIIVYPIEALLIYYHSNYYKDLKEKYYLFITFNKGYKTYNKIIKSNEYIMSNSSDKFNRYNDLVLISFDKEITYKNNDFYYLEEKVIDYLKESFKIDLKIIVLIESNLIKPEDKKYLKNNDSFIIYSK